jgi:hypothetical protein
VPCIIGHFMCHGKPWKEKINKGGGGGWANSSSKAFGISFADRQKLIFFWKKSFFSQINILKNYLKKNYHMKIIPTKKHKNYPIKNYPIKNNPSNKNYPKKNYPIKNYPLKNYSKKWLRRIRRRRIALTRPGADYVAPGNKPKKKVFIRRMVLN